MNEDNEKKNKKRIISFKTKKDTITSIIIMAAVVVIIIAVVNIAGILMNYKKGDDTYTDLEHVAAVTKENETEAKKQTIVIDFDALKAVCPDAIGWIWQQGQMSYPIVQGADNSYYLTHLYNGEENRAGTLFADYRIDEGMEASNCIIYGHNMQNRSMFGSLIDYKNESYFKEHPDFQVYVGPDKYLYKVFSVYVTDEISDTYTYAFGSEESYQNYLDMVSAWSRYDTGVEVTAQDKILTLSTCTGTDDSGQRLIVHLVRGEKMENLKDYEKVEAEY